MLCSSAASDAVNPSLKRKGGGQDHQLFPVGFKRLEVNAIRGFPHACGSLAQQANREEEKRVVGDMGSSACARNPPKCTEDDVRTDAKQAEVKASDGTGSPVEVKVTEVGGSSRQLRSSFKNSSNGKIRETSAFSVAGQSRPKLDGVPNERTSSVCRPRRDKSPDPKRPEVMKALDLFRETCMKLFPQLPKERRSGVYVEAAVRLKTLGKWVNAGHFLGAVPGVETGDRFHSRAELAVVGLHRPFMDGIDSTTRNGRVVATSIVASERYANDIVSSGVLIYSGHGGNPKLGNKQPQDQKLEGGNLALKNSMVMKSLVRVVCAVRDSKLDYLKVNNGGKSKGYVYDGLYYVDDFWHERGEFGKVVYKFKLRRFTAQAQADNSHKVPSRPTIESTSTNRGINICVYDISRGKEKKPICALNALDREKPPSFDYFPNLIYPKRRTQPAPSGCDCFGGCSDPEKCACAAKNGGGFPFNRQGALYSSERPVVYECGPSCKCSSSCSSRVSQNGIRVPLEVFKTQSTGWGVRSRAYIPIGSFICEYVGELLLEREAERRVGNDDYLFDIGRDRNDVDHKGVCFTTDAARTGNVGRFINHSCTPNVYAQDVLHDHQDKRLPHVMLFAATSIAPMRELAYDYNYMMDQARDKNGNLKKMNCYCGSQGCVGRLY